MFETYDTKRFGEYIKNIRKKLHLSQEKVAKSTKLSTETLRKIENGLVVPRYDTLEYLSRAYKIDVLDAFKNYRTSELLLSFYQHVDQIILDYDIKQISTLEEQLDVVKKNIENESFIEIQDLEQIRFMILGIKFFYEGQPDKAFDYFVISMRNSQKHFDLHTFNKNNYSVFESRILLMISMCIASMEKLEDANIILEHVLTIICSTVMSLELIKLKTKIYFNLAYNCHTMNDLDNVVSYSTKGIEHCIVNHSNYLLHGLYYRRGIAAYMLKGSNYIDDLKKSKTLLEITGNESLLEVYRKVTFDNYSIHF